MWCYSAQSKQAEWKSSAYYVCTTNPRPVRGSKHDDSSVTRLYWDGTDDTPPPPRGLQRTHISVFCEYSLQRPPCTKHGCAPAGLPSPHTTHAKMYRNEESSIIKRHHMFSNMSSTDRAKHCYSQNLFKTISPFCTAKRPGLNPKRP